MDPEDLGRLASNPEAYFPPQYRVNRHESFSWVDNGGSRVLLLGSGEGIRLLFYGGKEFCGGKPRHRVENFKEILSWLDRYV